MSRPKMIGARPHVAGGCKQPKKLHRCRVEDTRATFKAAFEAFTKTPGRSHLARPPGNFEFR